MSATAVILIVVSTVLTVFLGAVLSNLLVTAAKEVVDFYFTKKMEMIDELEKRFENGPASSRVRSRWEA